ncbi:hypothetical protein PTKIN_Ptkin05aG0222600 [Pterospermum kingtungense]
MARGIPNYDGGGSSYEFTGGVGSGGSESGRQYTTRSSSPSPFSSFPRLDSFNSSLNRGTIGDVFFGTDDIKETRELSYKEDVLESYRRETARKSLRRRSKKGPIWNFGCVEFLKLFFCCFRL